MGLIDIERRIQALCLSAEPSAPGLQALGDQKGWLVYRDLVRTRLREELRLALPRTYRAVGEQAFERAFTAHLDREPPRSRFFRDVALQFVKSALPLWRADGSLPGHAVDLAQYEGAVCSVADLPGEAREQVPAVQEFAFDKVPVLASALQLLKLDHPVHRDPPSGQSYEKEVCWLSLHRAADDQPVKIWELNGLSYELMTLWQQGHHTVTSAVAQVTQARNLQVDQRFVDGLCTVLADFIERGIVRGSR